jgi:uncharacterized membrane protein
MGSAVRLHFQEKPWDLYAAMGYTLGIVAILASLNVGNFFAILLVLFVPGYVLVAALFPSRTELDWIERLALSFGLSIAVVPLLGLLLNFVWAIQFIPIVVTITIFTILVGLAANVRRMRLPVDRRLSATLELSIAGWKDYRSLDKVLTVVLAASIVIAAATLAYVLLAPRPGERFTEFFILGPTGNATQYPTSLSRGQNGTLFIGLANHESANVTYTVRVDLVGVQIIHNSTSGYNETVEVNRTTWSWINTSLGNGANWTQRYTFAIPNAGLWEVRFLLLKNGVLSTQELHLFIRVR